MSVGKLDKTKSVLFSESTGLDSSVFDTYDTAYIVESIRTMDKIAAVSGGWGTVEWVISIRLLLDSAAPDVLLLDRRVFLYHDAKRKLVPF